MDKNWVLVAVGGAHELKNGDNSYPVNAFIREPNRTLAWFRRGGDIWHGVSTDGVNFDCKRWRGQGE